MELLQNFAVDLESVWLRTVVYPHIYSKILIRCVGHFKVPGIVRNFFVPKRPVLFVSLNLTRVWITSTRFFFVIADTSVALTAVMCAGTGTLAAGDDGCTEETTTLPFASTRPRPSGWSDPNSILVVGLACDEAAGLAGAAAVGAAGAAGRWRLRVGDEVREWRDGEALVFDDSYEHEVGHEAAEADDGADDGVGDGAARAADGAAADGAATRSRVVLIVDIWHPAIPPAARRDFLAGHRDETARYEAIAHGRAPLEAMGERELSDDEVRRFGRWKSDCWRRYVYSARGAVSGLAAAMSRVHVTPKATAREFRAAAP